MSISRLRTEVQDLKKLVISQCEPICKVFILGTKEATEAEIEALRALIL